jgi:hypothetical protein
VRQSQGTQEKDVGVKDTSLQHQDVCSVPITKQVNPGIIRLESIWVYTETIT